jgi:hypothetical protein
MSRLWDIARRLKGETLFTSGEGLPFEIIEVSATGLKVQTSTGSVYSLGRERIEGACRLRQRGTGIRRENLLRAGHTKKAAGNLSYTPVIAAAILGITTEEAMSDGKEISLSPETLEHPPACEDTVQKRMRELQVPQALAEYLLGLEARIAELER